MIIDIGAVAITVQPHFMYQFDLESQGLADAINGLHPHQKISSKLLSKRWSSFKGQGQEQTLALYLNGEDRLESKVFFLLINNQWPVVININGKI